MSEKLNNLQNCSIMLHICTWNIILTKTKSIDCEYRDRDIKKTHNYSM